MKPAPTKCRSEVRLVGGCHCFAFLAASGVLVQDHFSEADGGWGYFEALVGHDVLQRLFQREGAVDGEVFGLISCCCSHIGLFLGFGGVDVHVLRAGVFADDHAFVDVSAGAYE